MVERRSAARAKAELSAEMWRECAAGWKARAEAAEAEVRAVRDRARTMLTAQGNTWTSQDAARYILNGGEAP